MPVMLLTCTPFILLLAYFIGWWFQATIPAAGMQCVLLLSIGLALLLNMKWVRLENRQALIFSVFALMWLLWISFCNLMVSGSVAAWWKVSSYALALGLIWSISGSKTKIESLLETLGIAASLAAVVVFVVIWYHEGFMQGAEGGIFFWGFGYGHPNLFLNTAGLTSVGYSIWLCWNHFFVKRGSVSVLHVIIAALGFTATVALAYLLQRRGVSLAIACGISAIFLRWLWDFRPKLVLGILGFSLMCLLSAATWLFWNFTHVARAERVLIYAGLVDYGSQSPFFGTGSYSARHLSESSGEHARHFSSKGEWALHGHNDFLDAFVDAGIPGLLLAVIIVGWVFWRCLCLRPSAERAWLIFMCSGLLAVAMIDNALARITGMWLPALVVGLLLRMVREEREAGSEANFNPIRLALPLGFFGVLSFVMGLSLVPYAVLSEKSSDENVINAYERNVDPELMAALLPLALDRLPLEDVRQDLAIELHERRIGGSLTTLFAKSNRIQGSPHVKVADKIDVLRSIVRYVPFNHVSWMYLGKLIAFYPREVAALEPADQLRALRHSGSERLREPVFPIALNGMESAIDLVGDITWCTKRKVYPAGLKESFGLLIDQYGDIPEVAILALEYLVDHDDLNLNSRQIATLGQAMTERHVAAFLPVIRRAENTKSLSRLLPIFKTAFPGIFADFERGIMVRGKKPWRDDYFHLHQACALIWGASRR